MTLFCESVVNFFFTLLFFVIWYGLLKKESSFVIYVQGNLFEIHCLMLVTKIPKLVAAMWGRATFWNLLSRSSNVCCLTCGEDVTSVCFHMCCFSLAS